MSLCLSLSLSLAFLLLGVGEDYDVIYLYNSFTCVLRIIILNVTERQSERKREGITSASRIYTIKKKRRNKIRNLWLWLVCCSLLPTCYFHRPFTLALTLSLCLYCYFHRPFTLALTLSLCLYCCLLPAQRYDTTVLPFW